MSTEHPYRPCPSCGGLEFDSLPDLAFELHQVLPGGMMKIPGLLGIAFTAVVCSGCGKTDFYTKNAPKIADRAKGATHFRAAQR
jgi:predicted nucleic-acid-binding Zn-ribbon protein